VDRRRRTQPELEGDREARSIALSLGRVVRTARKRARMTQDTLGALVGLHRSRISEIERGEATGTPLVVWARLGIVLRRPISVAFSRDLEPPTPADAGHLDGQESVLGLARRTGRPGRFELPTRPHDPTLSVDVCVRDDQDRTLILHEIWNRFDDLGRASRSSDRKVAEAAELAIGIGGGRPYRVALCWLLVDNAANRALLARYPEIFATRFPGSSRRWVEALTTGRPVPIEPGIAWIDPRAGRIVPMRRPRPRMTRTAA
jgi:transcriptional regulator with XRE-family HTH domain